MKSKFKKGDKVKIVKYGHLIWEHKSSEALISAFPVVFEDENLRYLDLEPEIVGKKDIITKIQQVQGKYSYSLRKLGSWYSEQQLELINTTNDNNN